VCSILLSILCSTDLMVMNCFIFLFITMESFYFSFNYEGCLCLTTICIGNYCLSGHEIHCSMLPLFF
jgi:hypothetical protein